MGYFNYLNHSKDTIIFGKKITTDNIRRVIRKITWTSGNRYEIYRHDYNSSNTSPITDSSRLYELFSKMGFNYGASHQGITRIYKNDKEILAELLILSFVCALVVIEFRE